MEDLAVKEGKQNDWTYNYCYSDYYYNNMLHNKWNRAR
jgi:hypothetical protein